MFEDILTIGLSNSTEQYFIGTIVYKKEDTPLITNFRDHLQLIDGQQRITTIVLLLCSMCNYLKDIDEKRARYIYNNFIMLNDENNSRKLHLTSYDDETLNKIVSSLFSDINIIFNKENEYSIRIYTAYEFFSEKVTSNNIETLIKGFRKLNIIGIGLDGDDNAQLIFENLNSTGLALSKSDLIRNYILMNLDSKDQEYIYKTYWRYIESGFINNETAFDNFIKQYLTIKLGYIPTKSSIYDEFKDFVKNNYNNNPDLLMKDIYKYVQYYFKLFEGKEEDIKLKQAFDDLSFLENQVYYPFLLSVYNDYEDGILKKEEFIKIIK